jgi:hypothetical protein
VSVHRTISTAVLQHFAAACVRTALAEPAGSGDVSSAFAASPDVAAMKSRGCVATCDFSVSGRDAHPQSCPCRHRHRNDDDDYERRASGHVAEVTKPRTDAGGSGQLKAGWSRDLEKHEWNHGHGISQNTSCGIKRQGGG